MIDEGILPAGFISYRQTEISTFDIETCERAINKKSTDCRVIEGVQQLISISCCFGTQTKTFVRKDSTKDEGVNCVKSFLNQLFAWQESIEESLPNEIHAAEERLERELEATKFGTRKIKLGQWKRHLKSYSQLLCFGFNSGINKIINLNKKTLLARFDIPVLLPHIFALFSDVKILKRDTTYIQIQVGQIVFRDVLSFTNPCSLSKYLKSWGILEGKSCFPHSYYKSIESIRIHTEFPQFLDFHSNLSNKLLVTREEYEKARNNFYLHKSLPESDPNHWSSMVDHLIYYNELDVRPLLLAVSKSFTSFFKMFDYDPNLSLSLPSLSFK